MLFRSLLRAADHVREHVEHQHRQHDAGGKHKQRRMRALRRQSAQIAAEIAEKLAREFGGENAALEALQERKIEELSQAERDFEIGVLLRKKLRNEEDDLILLLLMAAAAS